MKISNLQYCCDDKIEYTQYMKNEYNVDIIFDDKNDFDDELTIAGEFDNVKNAIFAFFDDDIDEIKFHCPEILK